MRNCNRSLSFDGLEKRELMVVEGNIQFSLKPPQLGQLFQAQLNYVSSPNYNIAGTDWYQIVTYKGDTTSPVDLTGSRLTAQMVSDIPGTYKIFADTTYTSTNPSVSPPTETEVTGQITIPTPTVVIKKGGMKQPTNINGVRQMTYSVTAGGLPVGQYFIGHIQESISKFTFPDGSQGGGKGWQPPSPSQQFNFNNSTINDQFSLKVNQSVWNSLSVGSIICTFTQELRFTWMMGTDQLNDVPETAYLNTFDWVWTKDGTNIWEAN